VTSFFGNLTHFGALVFFAAVVSVTFAFLSKRTNVERLKYSLLAFLAFLVVAVGIGWLMYPFSQ
jgi:predicted PurR-regulated permease PerM